MDGANVRVGKCPTFSHDSDGLILTRM